MRVAYQVSRTFSDSAGQEHALLRGRMASSAPLAAMPQLMRQEVQRNLKQPYLKERVNVSNCWNKVWNKRLQFVLDLYCFGSVPGKKHHHG